MMKSLSLSVALGSALALTACSDVPDAPRAQVEEVNAAVAPVVEPAGPAEQLTLDPAKSSVGYIGAKVTQTHEGGFRTVSGSITLHPDAVERSAIEVRVATDSLFADEEKLTNHLKSPDFFDVAQFPEASFRSTSIRAGGSDGATHTITGDLTMHGQTKAISFPATVVVTAESVEARAEFTINRKDFGIVYPGMPDDLIRDDVVLKIAAHAAR